MREAVAKAALISPSPQLVWLLRELVKSGVLGADGVCMTFMKQIAGKLCHRSKVTTACTPPCSCQQAGRCWWRTRDDLWHAAVGVRARACSAVQPSPDRLPEYLCTQLAGTEPAPTCLVRKSLRGGGAVDKPSKVCCSQQPLRGVNHRGSQEASGKCRNSQEVYWFLLLPAFTP